MKYPKSYTMKEWNRFGNRLVEASALGNEYRFFNFFTKRFESYDYVTLQEILCIKYSIILTDYKTKKEKINGIISKVNIKNLNSGITKFNKGMNEFTKVIGSNQKSSKPVNFGISQKDYDSLFRPKRKGNSMNFWNEDKKTRKRRNKRKPVQNKGLALYSERKMKFF